jgi:hypothetical protein
VKAIDASPPWGRGTNARRLAVQTSCDGPPKKGLADPQHTRLWSHGSTRMDGARGAHRFADHLGKLVRETVYVGEPFDASAWRAQWRVAPPRTRCRGPEDDRGTDGSCRATCVRGTRSQIDAVGLSRRLGRLHLRPRRRGHLGMSTCWPASLTTVSQWLHSMPHQPSGSVVFAPTAPSGRRRSPICTICCSASRTRRPSGAAVPHPSP